MYSVRRVQYKRNPVAPYHHRRWSVDAPFTSARSVHNSGLRNWYLCMFVQLHDKSLCKVSYKINFDYVHLFVSNATGSSERSALHMTTGTDSM